MCQYANVPITMRHDSAANWHIGILANYSLFLKQESVPFAISPYQSYQCDTKIKHKSELLRLDVKYRRLEEIDNKRTEQNG